MCGTRLIRNRTARAAISPSIQAANGMVWGVRSVCPVRMFTAADIAACIAVVWVWTKLIPRKAMIAMVILAIAVLPTVFK